MAEPLVDGDLEAVIDRIQAVKVAAGLAELGERTTSLHVGAILGQRQVAIVDRRVQIVEAHQVCGLGSDVGHAEAGVREDLTLQGEIPVVSECRYPLAVYYVHGHW